MNSNSKFQENEENLSKELEAAAAAKAALAAKIENQIRGYGYRKLSAANEYAAVCRAMRFVGDDYEERFVLERRAVALQLEMIFCRDQIQAYKNNDHKAKIIPDRLL